jgi:hypothetical protein
MASSQPAPDFPAGLIGGRYVVEGALGRGGMAAVYRVRDAKTGERLALKRSWAKDTQRATRRKALLEREFHTLAQLSHPRIIEVYDYGVDEDGPYYTMELLDGADLDQAGALPWQQACALLRDLASSLAILHSRGLVHRDVSSRNVRRTADGRAKLIDFGAMASMGVANDVVGTPPFMAPEVLQMQSLDARADLFSLGALGYYLLTARHAYPARRTSELRDAWRSRPAPPSRIVADVPAALSTLILQLLSLDRGARPQHAAEIMERLCAIAELPKEELPEISRAYLSTPTLVGRDKALLAIRSHMLSLVRGDGGALLLEGVAGSGRSRMIDACVFEAKLLSALVLRADSSDAGGPWGVARAICSQLFSHLPELAMEATHLSQGVLAHVLEEVRRDGTNTLSHYTPERSLILRELRDFVLAMARGQRLLIVVDDADRIDEPSAAWLAALADKTERQGIMLVLAMAPQNPKQPSRSLQLFGELAHTVLLAPLDAEQTESLMRSVFGDVRHLGLWAGRIHEIAEGNPRTTMELAQHLVDRGFARYEAGSWLLPAQLEDIELPRTLAESLASRLETLSADARELAEALAVADAQSWPLASYRALTRHRDQKRLFAALEELVSARVLIAGHDRYRFSQHGFRAVLLVNLPDARKIAIHARLAEHLAVTGGEVNVRAHHLMHAERKAEAVQLLCNTDLLAKLPPLRLLERALAFAERDGSLSARALHRLRMALLGKAALVGAVDSFRRNVPPALAQLERDSGLAAYRELTDVPVETRLTQALALQQQRYLATPESEQVYSVGDALREIARLIGATCSMASSAFDLELLETLPSLEPFLPLSPGLRVVDQLRHAGRAWLSGRVRAAVELYEQALARLAEPDRAGMDDSQYQRTRAGIEYMVALIESSLGIARAEERAQYLETHRGLRVNAWRVRMLLALAQGDANTAQKHSRRAELLLLQDEVESHYLGTTTGFQLGACHIAEDLLGVKASVDGLIVLSETQPGWRPMLVYGQSVYRQLSGDPQGALDLLRPGLELTQPTRHNTWGLLAAQHVRLLHELGQLDEAVEMAQQYCAISAREQLSAGSRVIRNATARLLAHVGRHAEAIEMIEGLLAEMEAMGSRGMTLGLFFESRARIAVAMGDRAAFDTYFEPCAREYARGKNPSLSAKLGRLLEHARQHGVAADEQFDVLLAADADGAPDTTDESTVVTRLLECTDARDRARCALTMLLQSTDSYLGHLFGVGEAELTWLAGLPEALLDQEMVDWLGRWVRAERELAASAAAMPTTTSDGDVTGTEPPSAVSRTASADAEPARGEVTPVWVDAEGRRFRAVLLIDHRQEQRRIAAVLSLQLHGEQRGRPPLRLMTQIAGQLLDHGDVPGVAFDVLQSPSNNAR